MVEVQAKRTCSIIEHSTRQQHIHTHIPILFQCNAKELQLFVGRIEYPCVQIGVYFVHNSDHQTTYVRARFLAQFGCFVRECVCMCSDSWWRVSRDIADARARAPRPPIKKPSNECDLWLQLF